MHFLIKDELLFSSQSDAITDIIEPNQITTGPHIFEYHGNFLFTYAFCQYNHRLLPVVDPGS